MRAAVYAAGKFPDQKGVYISKDDLARFRQFSRARHIVQNPTNLQATEVSRQWEAGLALEAALAAIARKLGNRIFNPGVLPDERVANRFAGLAIPHDGRFALVGNTDSGKIVWAKSAQPHGLSDNLLGPPPDLLGVVFHPTCPGINLLVLFLRQRNNPARLVEHNKASACRPLIDGSDVAGHG